MRQAAGELGIPVLVYEGGERGVKSVLHHLGMIKSNNKFIVQKSKSVVTNNSRWVRAPVSGLIQPTKEIIARHVNKGDVLAYVHDPFLINPSQEVVAPFEGIVVGQALKAMATEGDALFHIATFKKIAGVRAYIEAYRDEIAED